jgi:arsenical pump membrane protein
MLRAALIVCVAGAAAGVIGFGPHSAAAAIQQAWPPFALVAGLLLIGEVAANDNVFAAAGSRIAAIRGGPPVLLAASLGLVAIVTAVLNLDTAVVFLTPVLIQAARSRGLNETAFVYGTVLMSNSASLLLPGSNLTNLLVLDGARVTGLDFARTMFAPWLVSVIVTGLVLWIVQRRQPTPSSTASGTTLALTGHSGAVGIAGAAVLLVALPDPAVAMLLLGVGLTVAQRLAGRAGTAAAVSATPIALVGLFVLAVCLGTLSRVWAAPAMLVTTAGRWEALAIGTLGAVAINNLPAASLLGSHPLAHPFFLLLGLNLGPNLAVTGSLSAILWLRVARHAQADASIWTYTLLGLVVVPLSLAVAAATLVLVHPAT